MCDSERSVRLLRIRNGDSDVSVTPKTIRKGLPETSGSTIPIDIGRRDREAQPIPICNRRQNPPHTPKPTRINLLPTARRIFRQTISPTTKMKTVTQTSHIDENGRVSVRIHGSARRCGRVVCCEDPSASLGLAAQMPTPAASAHGRRVIGPTPMGAGSAVSALPTRASAEVRSMSGTSSHLAERTVGMIRDRRVFPHQTPGPPTRHSRRCRGRHPST